MKKPKQFIVSVTLQKKKIYKHIYHNIKIKANWENKLIKKKGRSKQIIRTSNTRAVIGIKSRNRQFPIRVINNQLLPHFNTHKQALIKLQNN